MTINALSVGIVGVLGVMGIGLYGLLGCRNLIKIIIALQILAKGALLGLIVAGQVSDRMNLSQSMAVTVIVADTVVAVVGMALAVQVKRGSGTLDARDLAKLKG